VERPPVSLLSADGVCGGGCRLTPWCIYLLSADGVCGEATSESTF
jgi:hypothetical protein